MNAMMIAMYFVLDGVSLKINDYMKLTFNSFAVIICVMLFGMLDGCIVAAVGGQGKCGQSEQRFIIGIGLYGGEIKGLCVVKTAVGKAVVDGGTEDIFQMIHIALCLTV